MKNQTQTELTKVVRENERYIRTAGAIKSGKYGDRNMAEDELIGHGEDLWLLDRWEFNTDKDWFQALVTRQARVNWYLS